MKISIIIPVYNVGELLRKSVDSVLPQINDHGEIIIVDDGSTDDSDKICDEYSGADNVTIIHKPNGGLSSARNAGIKVAKGDYLLFLDSDDYLRPGSIRLLTSLVRQVGKFDFIQFSYDEVSDYSDNQEPGEICGLFETTDRRQMFEQKFSLGGIGASACTKLISKDVFRSLVFKEGIIHEDEQFTIHLINRANRAIYISNPLYMYVQRPGSIITSAFRPKRLDIIDVLEEQMSILKANGLDDLEALVRNNLFTALCTMYCKARKADARQSVDIIYKKARQIIDGVTIHGGTIGLIAKGMKMHLPMLQLYYLYKTISNEKG